jgi:hypothetical protein
MFNKLKDWANRLKAKREAKKYVKEEETSTIPKTAKQIATDKKEPWVGVLDTQVNPDNIRNGFFELDWNEYFIVQLKQGGYFGDTDEEVVDKWFQDLCRNIGEEAGLPMQNRGSGYVNRALRDDGKIEVS